MEVIRVDCPDEDVQEVIVWRRYNDFKKLYNAMTKLHQALHRNEEFPPFVESKVFGRFDEEVIKRRMLCGQDLLNFIGQRHYLVASRAFQQFFQDGELRKYEGVTPLLQPPMLPDSSDDMLLYADRPQPIGQDGDSDPANIEGSTMEGFPRVPSYNQLLGGVWRYRQIADEISLGGDDDDDEQTDYTDDSAHNTPVPDTDIKFFDPLKPAEEGEKDTEEELTCSNEWLLSQVTMQDVSVDADSTISDQQDDELKKLELEFAAYGIGETRILDGIPRRDSSGSGSSPLTGSLDCTESALELSTENSHSTVINNSQDSLRDSIATEQNILSVPRSGVVVDSGKGDLVWSPVHKQKPAAFHRPLHSLTSTPTASPQHSTSGSAISSPAHSPARHGLINIDVKDKADYIFLAANQISLAQQCEVNSNYHMAFSYYKSAVGIMLTGVQRDDNLTRREVVRKKTAKYLLKAEKLYHLYLDSRERGVHGERWDTAISSPAKELDPKVAFVQGSLSELKMFKVLGVIDKVLLIIDSMTDQTYVIKVLHKTCSGPLDHRNIVPINLPYVTRLHKYYETEGAIYLLLQHASGGRLWNYVSNYLQQHSTEGDLLNVLNDSHEKKLRTRTNTDGSDATLFGFNNKVKIPKGDSQMPAETGLVDIRQNGVIFDNTPKGNSEDLTAFYTCHVQDGEKVALGMDTSGDDAEKGSLVRKDSDGFSLEGSQDSASLHKALAGVKPKRKSNLHSISQEGVEENDENGMVMADNTDQFGELLEGTKCKPSLEQFSINSFDSDSGPGVRFESNTSDHIECIPELNEVSPPTTPCRIQDDLPPRSPDDVFSTHGEALSNLDNDISIKTVTEGNGVVCKNNDAPTDVIIPADNVPITSINVAVTTAGTPEDEPSIYDKYKEVETSDSHSDGETTTTQTLKTTTSHQCVKNQKLDQDRRTSSDLHKQAVRSSSTVIPPTQLPISKEPNTDLKPRRRNLSSLFGSFTNLEDAKGKTAVRLPEGCVRQWAAELVIALANLHSMGIICRDLKPSNLLLGDRGHILLTYFSQWNVVDQDLCVDARDLLYSAPEVGDVGGETVACDWWSLGALLFELLTGKSLSSCQPCGVTSHTEIHIPDDLSAEAQAILIQLLKYNAEERLGAGVGGVDDIKMHPFFSGVDWSLIQA